MEEKEEVHVSPRLDPSVLDGDAAPPTGRNPSTSSSGSEAGGSRGSQQINLSSFPSSGNGHSPPSAPSGQRSRGHWSSKWDYFLSLAGLAIGLGNVWRFPYVCYLNGGGAFLIPYLLILFLIGPPLFLLESLLGQFTSSGCLKIYNVKPSLKGIGYVSIVVNFVSSSYYSVVVAYPLVYIYHCFGRDLPWTTCNNEWNTERCKTLEDSNGSSLTIDVPPSEEFFHNNVLYMSSGITDINGFSVPLLIALIVVWIVVYFSIFRGVKILGKVWTAAATQIFFSLQTGWGSLVALGSFNHFSHKNHNSAFYIPLLNCFTSIAAGFVVFSVLGYMAHQMAVPVDQVVTGGTSLAYITYPAALSMMPWAQLWSVLFFLMLFFLSIDSLFVELESTIASMKDEFQILRNRPPLTAFGVCLIVFLLAIPSASTAGIYVVTLLDTYSIALPICVACLGEVVVFSYVYGATNLIRDFQMMIGRRLNPLWRFSWVFVTPCVLMVVIVNTLMSHFGDPVQYMYYTFPEWSHYAGLFIALSPITAIPIYWIYYRYRGHIQPPSKWGPAGEDDFSRWMTYCQDNSQGRSLICSTSQCPCCPRKLSTSQCVELGRW